MTTKVRIFGSDEKSRESLSQYIARCPVSLEKIKYEPFHGKVLFKTPKYNDYFKENFRVFNALEFIAQGMSSYSSQAQTVNSQVWFICFLEREHLVRLAPEG